MISGIHLCRRWKQLNNMPAADSESKDIFAEIDINPGAIGIAPESISFVPSAQQIAPRVNDPIRQRFYNMRLLAGNNPFAGNDAEIFYKQALFMADFEDNYAENEPYSRYYPYYQRMGYSQLRTYFTWRTQIRNGYTPSTSLSYIFLLVYELLSNIRVDSHEDGLDKIVLLWNAYRQREPALNKYLPGWIKDYCIYYPLNYDFRDFIIKNELETYYSDSLLFEYQEALGLDFWNHISSYDVKKSVFYKDGNEEILKACFSSVLGALKELYNNNQSRFEDLFVYTTGYKTPWYPFERALFYPWLNQPDRSISMPGQEVYYVRNNRLTVDKPIFYSSRKDFAAYIIKKTEACLRQIVNYKYKLAPDPSFVAAFLAKANNSNITLGQLESTIEKETERFYRDLTRTVVTVNPRNLERIREEALGTQNKLIVPEALIAQPDIQIDTPADIAPSPAASPLHESDGWRELFEALNETELSAVKMALLADPNVKAFADSIGIMLEVLVDNINEKANDFIGDSILELDNELTVYSDYQETINTLLSL